MPYVIVFVQDIVLWNELILQLYSISFNFCTSFFNKLFIYHSYNLAQLNFV